MLLGFIIDQKNIFIIIISICHMYKNIFIYKFNYLNIKYIRIENFRAIYQTKI